MPHIWPLRWPVSRPLVQEADCQGSGDLRRPCALPTILLHGLLPMLENEQVDGGAAAWAAAAKDKIWL